MTERQKIQNYLELFFFLLKTYRLYLKPAFYGKIEYQIVTVYFITSLFCVGNQTGVHFFFWMSPVSQDFVVKFRVIPYKKSCPMHCKFLDVHLHTILRKPKFTLSISFVDSALVGNQLTQRLYENYRHLYLCFLYRKYSLKGLVSENFDVVISFCDRSCGNLIKNISLLTSVSKMNLMN